MSEKLTASVRQACALPPDERAEEHITTIMEFVKDVAIFTRLTNSQQRALCRTMGTEQFEAKQIVFSIGDRGDKFYVVLSGQVEAQVISSAAPCPNDVHADNCDCPERPWESLMLYEPGSGFGDLAFHSDQPRSATMLTTQDTVLLVCTRADYEKYADRQQIEERVRFLRRCSRIEDALQRNLISHQDIQAMANCLTESSRGGCGIVVRQGDPVENLIFVRSGQLAMVRVLDGEVYREAMAAKARFRSLGSPVSSLGGSRRPTSKTPSSPGADSMIERRRRKASKPEAHRSDAEDKRDINNFTCKLARAMLEMRRQERTKKLEELAGAVIAGTTNTQTESKKKNIQESAHARKVKEMAVYDEEEGSDSQVRVKALWGMLRTSVKQAAMVNQFCTAVQPDIVSTPARVASRRISRHASKESTATSKRDFGKASKKSSEDAPGPYGQLDLRSEGFMPERPSTSGSVFRKRVLLRVGTVSQYEYFGDQQVGKNENYPVSLVSDPVAEMYMMTKSDIVRRLPKKLFSALFSLGEQEAVPPDYQLVELHNQTKRWDTFRWNMHGQAPNSGKRAGLNARANLEFLGINPNLPSLQTLIAPPTPRSTSLTSKDEEHFSQSSARFLRRFADLRRDPGLRGSLAKAGLDRRRQVSDYLREIDEDAPHNFYFNLHWANFRKPSLLDVDDISTDDTIKATFKSYENSPTSGVGESALERRVSTASATTRRRSHVSSKEVVEDRRPSSMRSRQGSSKEAGDERLDATAEPRMAPPDITISLTPTQEVETPTAAHGAVPMPPFSRQKSLSSPRPGTGDTLPLVSEKMGRRTLAVDQS